MSTPPESMPVTYGQAAFEAFIAFEDRHGLDLDPEILAELNKVRVSIRDVPRVLAEFEARFFPADDAAA